MKKLELFYPVKPYKLNQGFGENANAFYKSIGLLGHNGLDMYAVDGEIIKAAHDGIVTFTGEDSSGGYGVVIRTNEIREYGTAGAYFKTIYWHCVPNSFFVKPGQNVSVGDPIAKADSTGQSTGTHLHFGLKPVIQGEADWQWFNLEQNNGYLGAINPTPYLNNFYAEDYQSIWAQLKIIAAKVAALFSSINK